MVSMDMRDVSSLDFSGIDKGILTWILLKQFKPGEAFKYTENLVSWELVNELLEAAMHAPSAINAQP